MNIKYEYSIVCHRIEIIYHFKDIEGITEIND